MPVISKTNPVNWGHPLNYKRVLWWKCLSNSSGSLFDLCGGSSITRGALASGAKYAGGSNNHGIFSSIFLDGTDDNVTTINGSALPLIGAASQSMAAAFWFWSTSSASFPGLFYKSSGANRPFLFYGDTGVGRIYFLHSNGVTTPFAGTPTSGLAGARDGRWHRIIGVRDCENSLMKIYVDGVDATNTSSDIGFTTNYSSSQAIGFGGTAGGAVSFASCRFDDATIWMRALNASEIWQDYDLSRRGYPGVLNRLSNKVYFFIASGLAANPLRGGGAASNPVWGYIG